MNTNHHIDYTATSSVSRAVETRRSLRAFIGDDVSHTTVNDILMKAARAPSGTNTQPWQVYVVRGARRDALCDAVCHAFDNEAGEHQSENRYYPAKWFEPYLARRRKVGWDLYGLLDIKKGERDKTHAQHKRNFQFFDAPVGLMFTIHRDLEIGSWLDFGMFIQNIMLLAREAGLHTCPQVAWTDYHRVIRKVLPISPEEMVVCGMSLGYADADAVENTLVTEREPVDQFVQYFE